MSFPSATQASVMPLAFATFWPCWTRRPATTMMLAPCRINAPLVFALGHPESVMTWKSVQWTRATLAPVAFTPSSLAAESTHPSPLRRLLCRRALLNQTQFPLTSTCCRPRTLPSLTSTPTQSLGPPSCQLPLMTPTTTSPHVENLRIKWSPIRTSALAELSWASFLSRAPDAVLCSSASWQRATLRRMKTVSMWSWRPTKT